MDFESVIAERVAKGAIIMDTYHGGIGWAERIDTETLNMALWNLCVVGQYFGNYSQGMDKLGISLRDEAWEFGFNIAPDDECYYDLNHSDYALLEIAWIDEIGKRIAEMI